MKCIKFNYKIKFSKKKQKADIILVTFFNRNYLNNSITLIYLEWHTTREWYTSIEWYTYYSIPHLLFNGTFII